MSSADREAKPRRFTHREGLVLEKSRARHAHRTDQGGYRLVDPYLNETVGRRAELSADLDAIEAFPPLGSGVAGVNVRGHNARSDTAPVCLRRSDPGPCACWSGGGRATSKSDVPG